MEKTRIDVIKERERVNVRDQEYQDSASVYVKWCSVTNQDILLSF
jgi:hypothetical protein